MARARVKGFIVARTVWELGCWQREHINIGLKHTMYTPGMADRVEHFRVIFDAKLAIPCRSYK